MRITFKFHRWLLACLLLLGLAAAPAIAQVRATFDLPEQPLADSIRAIGQKTGTNILFDPALTAGKTARPVKGQLTVEEALAQALGGASELTVQRVRDGTLSVVARGRASSSDSGRAGAVALEGIVVTAQKREQLLVDVPASVAVIGNQEIERRGLIGMEDYLRSIPGVNQIDKGPASNSIVIRGITTTPEFENFASGATVATYFDEAPITGAGGTFVAGIDIRPVDIERIEVLRGPQGTAYGSSSLSGAVRIIPVKPRLDRFEGKVSAAYSNTAGYGDDNTMVQGAVNLPLLKDVFSVRLVGYRFDDSGFYRNIGGEDPALIAFGALHGLADYIRGHVEDDVGRMASTGGRVSARWQPTDRLSISFGYLKQDIEQHGKPEANVGPFLQSRTPVALQARLRGRAGEVGDSHIDVASGVAEFDLGWGTFTGVVSSVEGETAGHTTYSPSFNAILGPSALLSLGRYDATTYEARIASRLAGRVQFLAGLYHEDVKDRGFNNIWWPGPGAAPLGTNPQFIFDVRRKLEQDAAFGEVSYDITSQLTATIGGRYFRYDKTVNTLQEGGVVRTPIGTGRDAILSNSEDGDIYKANLSYKPRPGWLLYASFSQGFRLGRPDAGLVPFASLCDTNNDGIVDGTTIPIAETQSIKSDFLDNYEVGGKLTLFDKRLVIDTAMYHIKWDGLPINTIVGTCPIRYTTNAGSAESDGIEFQASFFPAEGLRFDFGFGYTNAVLTSDLPALNARKGARLPGTPKYNGNFAAQYDFNIAGRRAFARADAMYTGEFYGDLLATPGTKAGGYSKIDARFGIEIMRDFSAELFVKNLTDEDGYTWRGISGASSGAANPFFGYNLRPRTIGVQLNYRFG
jgi:iron complex outermembrane recepter protein